MVNQYSEGGLMRILTSRLNWGWQSLDDLMVLYKYYGDSTASLFAEAVYGLNWGCPSLSGQ
jgi:hypothetical protein